MWQLYLAAVHRNKQREAANTRRHRNVAQTEGQNKTPEEGNKMETSKLLDAEFKLWL